MLEPEHLHLQSRPSDGEDHNHSAVQARQRQPIDDIAALLCQQLGVYLSASQAAMAEKLNLSLTELKALELVQHFDALPTGQLGQLLGISWGGATALINRLEAAGYIQRGRHPLDRRVIVIRPVPERYQDLARERQVMIEEAKFVGRQFDTQELQVVSEFLKQYVRALRHNTMGWLNGRHDVDLNS